MSFLRRGSLPWSMVLVLGLAACRGAEPFEPVPSGPRPIRGAVVCEHPLASAVGVEILEAGGNAADAAVATALALAVVYPQAGNLGGGGFALWVPHSGEATALDFREVAPETAMPDRFRNAEGEVDPELSKSGPLAVGVPGSPAGLWALYQTHGSKRLSWQALCEPAIRLAEEGFVADSFLEAGLRSATVRRRMQRSPAALSLFYPGGIPLIRGQRVVQPELADTLRRLAEQGPDGFYRGLTATLLVQEIERQLLEAEDPRSWITSTDLEGYEVRWRDPLRGVFRGREVVSMPPPSSGGIVLLQVLAVLEGFPVAAQLSDSRIALRGVERDGADPGFNPRILHWWIEALRRSFAARAEYMGDPDHVQVPTEELLSPGWVARCRLSIGEQAMPSIAPFLPEPPPEGPQTTHLSVLDRGGNAVSLTTTLNSSFGAGILVEGAGFLLNNEIDDFAHQGGVPNQFGLVGSEANGIAAKKRPLSSMTPAVVRRHDGSVELVVGSPGGPRIITSVLAVVLRTLMFDQDLETAVTAPRFHQQWKPERTEFELGWRPGLLEGLDADHGHPLREVDRTWASVQAIGVLDNGEPVGVSDPRRGGAARVEER